MNSYYEELLDRGLSEDLLSHFDERWRYQVSIRSGWVPLVNELHERLAEIEPVYRIYQVKEKFGGLRYYTDCRKDDSLELIRIYESKSEKACEICGEAGEINAVNGWYRCLCPKHRQEELNKVK